MAFYLFLLKPSPLWGTLAIALLIVLTFVPIRVLHPVRVTRLRRLNLVLMAVWAMLAVAAVVDDFSVPVPVTAALCAIGLYIVFGDAFIRLMRPKKT